MRLVCVVLFALSCGGREDEAETSPLGVSAQALDTDLDGLDDAWELSYFGNLSQTATADFDGDGMTNAEEQTHGFNPALDDGLGDADGDRYPNVFEVRGGSDPNSSASTPSATYTVNASGGGTQTTISAALGAANVANGSYQIIAIAAGTYTGSANYRVTGAATKPKLLFIGLAGAAKTVIDGGQADWGWSVLNTAVIASLTFQKTWQGVWIDAPSKEVRLVDLVVRDNGPTTQYAAGVQVHAAAKVSIVGCTFFENAGMTLAKQIYFNAGSDTLTNTAVSATNVTGTMLAKSASASMAIQHSFVKGQALTGSGNLAG